MTTGSCLCGAVRYEITAPYKWMAHCHCSMCRKHHGTLYSTSVGVEPARFRWLQGEDAIVHYASSANFGRPFCSGCGSSLPAASGETVICPAGGLGDDLGIKPRAHIFVGSASPMGEITDDLAQFEEYPPGFGTPVPGPAAPPPKDGIVQGSCLCGEVAFEIDAPPRRMVNCHCSRCRMSRGAAHGTAVFAPMDKLRWTRGADRVRTYRLPQAMLFSTSFCECCGSLLPAPFDKISKYLVPVGSLDTVLPLRPGVNIHVASKAAWFDITDRLPQFEAMPPRERMGELMF